MADSVLSPPIWRKFETKANCFVPRLVAEANDRGIVQQKLADATKQTFEESGVSAHFIGQALDLKPKKHKKLKALIHGFNHLVGEEVLTANDIAIAAFRLVDLERLILNRGLSPAQLASQSGVSEKAVRYALPRFDADGETRKVGRVTAGIASAIHTVLDAENPADLPPLDQFASSALEGAPLSVEGKPFTYEDLMLPLPDPVPSQW